MIQPFDLYEAELKKQRQKPGDAQTLVSQVQKQLNDNQNKMPTSVALGVQ